MENNDLYGWTILTITTAKTFKFGNMCFGFTNFVGSREDVDNLIEEFKRRHINDELSWDEVKAKFEIHLLEKGEYSPELSEFLAKYSIGASQDLGSELLEELIEDMGLSDN